MTGTGLWAEYTFKGVDVSHEETVPRGTRLKLSCKDPNQVSGV